MSFKYGKTSLTRLETCHQDLRTWAHALLKVSPFDLTILCGHRNERDQMQAYRSGASKVKWPNSKHNQQPSLGIDIAPWENGVDWDFLPHFYFMGGQGVLVARALGINMRWGGDWNRNGSLKDNTFNDLVHFELM